MLWRPVAAQSHFREANSKHNKLEAWYIVCTVVDCSILVLFRTTSLVLGRTKPHAQLSSRNSLTKKSVVSHQPQTKRSLRILAFSWLSFSADWQRIRTCKPATSLRLDGSLLRFGRCWLIVFLFFVPSLKCNGWNGLGHADRPGLLSAKAHRTFWIILNPAVRASPCIHFWRDVVPNLAEAASRVANTYLAARKAIPICDCGTAVALVLSVRTVCCRLPPVIYVWEYRRKDPLLLWLAFLGQRVGAVQAQALSVGNVSCRQMLLLLFCRSVPKTRPKNNYQAYPEMHLQLTDGAVWSHESRAATIHFFGNVR